MMSIKVFIIDDSAFMRRIINDILITDSDIDVIGYARNGQEALEKLKNLKPDVITLDVEMPILDGIETLKLLMKTYSNIPVVMLSSLTQSGADMTMKALEIGAVDFIAKPKSIFNMDEQQKKIEIINKVKVASYAKVNVAESIEKKEQTSYIKPRVKKPISTTTKFTNIKSTKYSNIVAIGTSTGGPRALQAILPNIPQDVDAAIVVVQHMPPQFTKSLAGRLNSLSHIVVKEAEDGEILKRGHCYIAPGDFHMTIIKKSSVDLYIKLNRHEKVSGHRPSVDVMMDSVSLINNYKKIGVILTGMGGDGAKGIKKIRNNSGYTIAQDESSCVVFGMPKVAIKNNAIDKILSLNKIADEIITNVGV
ncbi:chemotaxis response regulator protein-glutamate methylesterase [Clostridiaceae bacterium M8S5]|nr:chemotaxis response regulator protein-glutamate methylesterase [Clostridiaceae bacterium M8S5]